ncbi:hypothetical protein [Bradyrhizobium valentinum]|nr:hypothetical protein [Bradyrhizobium valentinum]
MLGVPIARPGAAKIFTGVDAWLALLIGRSLAYLRRYNRKGCDLRPLGWLIAALPLHLPSGSEALWVLLALSEENR